MHLPTRLFIFLLTIVIAGCSSSPTGRKQLVLLSDSDLNKMGAESFESMKQETPASGNATITAQVQCVADRIIQVLPDKYKQQSWEVVLFEDPQVNAFALPGYKIGVYTGLLGVAKNQSQLAAVMGHEVGHVLARHGNERVSANMATSQILSLGEQLAGEDSKEKDLLFQALGMGAQVGILLPFSRSHESEADEIGLRLMAQAGFNPEESVQLWRNMSALGGKTPPELLSTHPSHETRIHDLEKNMAGPREQYQSLLSASQQAQCY